MPDYQCDGAARMCARVPHQLADRQVQLAVLLGAPLDAAEKKFNRIQPAHPTTRWTEESQRRSAPLSSWVQAGHGGQGWRASEQLAGACKQCTLALASKGEGR